MIVWQGFGFIAALIPLALLALLGMLNQSVKWPHGPEFALLVSAILVWFIGRKLNSREDRILIDPVTREEVRLRNKHTLFWAPMEWVSVPLVALAVATFVKA